MTAGSGVGEMRLDVAEAREIGHRALLSLDFTSLEADLIVDHLLLNAMSGYPFAGLPRIIAIRDAPERKEPRAPLSVVRETATSLQVDGGNQVAYVALSQAADLALAKVQESGICIMGVGNSWYSGRLANYLEGPARAGFIGIHVSSAFPIVAPHGAAKAMFGTNPICVAFPMEPNPVIVDVGTSQTMWGHVLLQSFLGIPLPEGQAIDSAGRLTTDAAAVVDGGAILPIAGHRGYALSFAVQALSLLGASVLPWEEYRGWGYLFVLFDPGLLCAPERFRQDFGSLIENIKALPLQPGVGEVLIPSERSWRARDEAALNGVVFDAKVIAELHAMADS